MNHNELKDTLFIIPLLTFSRSILVASGLTTLPPYKGEESFLLRAMRELHFRLNLPFKKIWFYPVNRQYSSFFIFDGVSPDYIQWLHKKYPQSSFIMFYMNKCQPYDSPDKYPFDFLNMWSGDEEDCKKWNVLRQVPTMGAYSQAWKIDKIEPEYDIFFVGKDKGGQRLKELMKLKTAFESYGLKTYFHIVADHRYDRYKKRIYKNSMPYNECLRYLSMSKAILYLGYGSQECVTIRIQESLVHKIKLITDCHWIKKFDFYRSQNIFILGEDKLDDLPQFLNTPYVEVKGEILEHLYFDDLAKEIISRSQKTR